MPPASRGRASPPQLESTTPASTPAAAPVRRDASAVSSTAPRNASRAQVLPATLQLARGAPTAVTTSGLSSCNATCTRNQAVGDVG
eukprot:scaffold82250_cov45-Phaeocystis_antarctica.AAC.1